MKATDISKHSSISIKLCNWSLETLAPIIAIVQIQLTRRRPTHPRSVPVCETRLGEGLIIHLVAHPLHA